MRLIEERCVRPLQFIVWQCDQVHSPDSNTYCSVPQSVLISNKTTAMSPFGPPRPPLSFPSPPFPFRWIHDDDDDGGEEGEIKLILLS